MNTDQEFGKIRKIIWPIQNHELSKFIPMVVMMFFFLFNYTIMRDTKDTLVVTYAGAEVIPFLKFWGTLPTSIIFVLMYTKLSNTLKPTTLFYTIITPFLVFFLTFGFIIYPNITLFMPTDFVIGLENFILNYMPIASQPTMLKLAKVISVWPYALFYVFSELWGSMGISLLFWQFANQITKTHEAKRFYGSFAQLGNLALIASGLTIIYCSDIRGKVAPGVDPWGETLKLLMAAITFGCVMIMIAYYWINDKIAKNPALCPDTASKAKKKSKLKLTIGQSVSLLFQSKYLRSIAILVVCYGISINLIEIVWKSQLKLLFPNENEYNTFMGYFSMSTGISTLLLVIIGNNIIRNLGWKAAALATPFIILITGGLFFLFTLYSESFKAVLPFTPLVGAVAAGTIQNILSKGTKYSLFDPTKEMSYIPLDDESKVKGKAAIDVVGARLGKSGGGVILQVVLMFGPIMSNLTLIFGFVCLIIFTWFKAVGNLSTLYHAKLDEKEHKKEEDTTSAQININKPVTQS